LCVARKVSPLHLPSIHGLAHDQPYRLIGSKGNSQFAHGGALALLSKVVTGVQFIDGEELEQQAA